MIAYILATCAPGQEKEAISKIKDIKNVVEVNGIMGRYDIFVKVSAKEDLDLHATITSIRDVTSITSTATFTAIYGQGGSVDDKE
ncbi:MAG TPA: Lrp/AsnC ligand binding domain-containing protein [Candidatus Nitrosotalea sp.]|nr:Lrp/AsnC ligand binding domain-containing protein [Candidatus Nitrosotalea sp.]